jgi:hypothetical protein
MLGRTLCLASLALSLAHVACSSSEPPVLSTGSANGRANGGSGSGGSGGDGGDAGGSDAGGGDDAGNGGDAASTTACTSTASCNVTSSVCCAITSLTGGTSPSCTTGGTTIACAAIASCPTTLPSTCTGTTVKRLCTADSDCGENDYPQCCTFPGNGSTSFCANSSVALAAGGACH